VYAIKLNALLRHSINEKFRELKKLRYPTDISLYYCDCDGEPAIWSQPRGWIMLCEVVTQLTAVSPGVLGRLEPNRPFFCI